MLFLRSQNVLLIALTLKNPNPNRANLYKCFVVLPDYACTYIFYFLLRCRTKAKMSALGDAAEAAAERVVYEKGGYPALIRYKVVRIYKTYCGCCA